MDISNKKTGIILLIGILWIVITILGWKEQYLAGMYLGVVLILLHLVLGAAKNGVLSLKIIVYPLLVFGVLWCASFYLSNYYAEIFSGRIPDFTIMGFHPSFAWTVLTYWLGGLATLTVGFVIFKNEWLSEKDWEDFKDKIKQDKQGEVK